MPPQQQTFKLVPTTLVNTKGPRPPMTSKAAKKAYREANRLPRVSRAEQRRIEAAEIARQKKEYEKEKAAAKAKTAREKKAKKEADERVKRKELGLPEPSRFVRPSQPTIKTFVKSGVGQKRSWEEANSKEADNGDSAMEASNGYQLSDQVEALAKRIALEPMDEEDEFGDFPSLSQADLPGLCAVAYDTSPAVSIDSSPCNPLFARPQAQSVQSEAAKVLSMADQIEFNTLLSESQSFAEAMPPMMMPPTVHQCQSSAVTLNAASSSHDAMTHHSVGSTPAVSSLYAFKTVTPAIPSTRARKLVEENLRSMPPPAIPITVNRLKSRVPLSDVSKNILKPPRLAKTRPVTSLSGAGAKSNQMLERGNSCMPPPSTLAFLEVHLDDFFPSPSQQIRELLEDVDDVPSNTQITREIDLEQENIAVRVSHIPSPLPQPQARIEDDALRFLSSQDLEISSQDLRDIDTPSKAMPESSPLRDLTNQNVVLDEAVSAPPPTPKLKPRFFEEKEDDLLYAALHESLLQSTHTTQGFSHRKSQRILRRTESIKTDHGRDDYGSDGSDIDADFLALLDGA